MKLLIINQYSQSEFKETQILPRVGDRLDMFYKPRPTVKEVILFPTTESLEVIKCYKHVDAIILTE